MAAPIITGFSTGENLGVGQFGLNTRNGSSNNVFINGNGMASGCTVKIDNNAGITWDGSMGNFANGAWPATLTCSNTTSGEGDTMNVDVTVTNSSGETSPRFRKQVTVGSV